MMRFWIVVAGLGLVYELCRILNLGGLEKS